MKQEEFIALAQKYSEGNCTPQEKKLVETFFEENQKNDFQVYLSQKRKEQLFSKIKENTSLPHITKKPAHTFFKITAAAVILIGLVISLQFFTSPKTVVHVAAKGEKREVLLHDGSLVILNSNSTISYPQEFGDTRDVQLKGQAYFKVKRDTTKPFIVNTKSLQVKVLGTSFDVNTNAYNVPKVSVVSGKVQVTNNSNKSDRLIITKNQQATLANKKLLKTQEDSKHQIAWTQNIIRLENTSLKETARILENWYDIKIEFKEKQLENLTISGKFKDEKLQNVLKSLTLLKNLKIDTLTTSKHILIRKNN